MGIHKKARLGPAEKRIVAFLAENPGAKIEEIQRAAGHKQRATTHGLLQVLRRKGAIDGNWRPTDAGLGRSELIRVTRRRKTPLFTGTATIEFRGLEVTLEADSAEELVETVAGFLGAA